MEICASTENLEADWESGNVDTGGSSTVTESHSPSAIASDELHILVHVYQISDVHYSCVKAFLH